MPCYPGMLTAVAREQSVIEGGVMTALDCQRVFQLSICFHIASLLRTGDLLEDG